MQFDFLDRFSDPYLRSEAGKGVFLSGIVLGIVAAQQTEKGSISDAPLFKQISFGQLQIRDIQRLLARVPDLAMAYRLKNAGRVSQLLGTAGELLLQSGKRDLGIDGNFAFSVAFTNAWRYYKEIFPKETEEDAGKTSESQIEDEQEE